MLVDCSKCGTEFDTERDPATPGADTDRCPYCGTPRSRDEKQTATDGGDATELEVGPGATVTITIEVEPGK